MAVNCTAHLPVDVGPDEVAEVMGILAGCPAKRKQIDNARSDAIFVEVAGAKVEQTTITHMCEIHLEAPRKKLLVDGEEKHFTTFHFCSRRNGKVWNIVYPKATTIQSVEDLPLDMHFSSIIREHHKM